MSDQPGPPPGGGDAPPPSPAAPPAPVRTQPSTPPTPAPAPQAAAPTTTWGAAPATPATPSAQAAPSAPTAPPPGTTWGGTPAAPPKPQGPRSTSGRTAAIVLAIIVGVVVGVNVVNAALPLPEDPALVDPGPGVPVEPVPTDEPAPGETPLPGESQGPGATLTPIRTLPPLDPGPVEAGDAIDVGAGFQVTPPEGWTVVGGEEGLTVLQKGGALLIVGGFPWPETPTALAELYRDGWFATGEFSAAEPQTGEIGNGIPAAVISYTGVASGTAMDGAIVAGVVDGNGLILNVFGAPESLEGVSADIDQMLSTVTSTGG